QRRLPVVRVTDPRSRATVAAPASRPRPDRLPAAASGRRRRDSIVQAARGFPAAPAHRRSARPAVPGAPPRLGRGISHFGRFGGHVPCPRPCGGSFPVRTANGEDTVNFERLTVKAAEAIQAAAASAQRRGNPQIEDLHLLEALLDQEERVVVPVLEKVGVNVARLREELGRALDRLPRQTGGSSPALGREAGLILDRAEGEARALGDEYTSTEHLLIALAAHPR